MRLLLIPMRLLLIPMRLFLIAMALLSLSGLSCREPLPSIKPHIFLLTVDTLRSDHLSHYGHPRPTSPHLDRFSRDSHLFEQAVTPIPKTRPAFSTLFTGLHPRQHLVRENDIQVGRDLPVLGDTLRSAGYRTAAFLTNRVITRESGLERGFDVFSQAPPTKSKTHPVNQAFARWDKQSWKQPTFVWLHYSEPHGPYKPGFPISEMFNGDPLSRREGTATLDYVTPEGYFTAQILGAIPRYQQRNGETRISRYVSLYDGEIRLVDRALGWLLNILKRNGLYESSAIVFLSDHGESLGEHNYYFEHGYLAFEPSLRIPLLIKQPNQKEGMIVREPASLMDLFPTLASFAGIEVPGKPGRNLLAPSQSPRGFLIENSDRYPERFLGIRTGRYKYIRDSEGAEELYDLYSDPSESFNIAPRSEYLAGLRKLYFEAEENAPMGSHRPPRTSRPVDPHDIEALRAMGYLD